jgi:hypothetical protein
MNLSEMASKGLASKKNKTTMLENISKQDCKKKSKKGIPFIWPQNKNIIHGLYISKDGKKKETKNGTENHFIDLLCGSMSEYPIGEGYRILYNKKSRVGENKFLLVYVHDTSIEGPIIFINDKKKNININEIKELLKKEVNQQIFAI